MEARNKKRLALTATLLVGILIVVLLAVPGSRVLTPAEQACVGNWSFVSADAPNTRIVYYLAADGSACEEHYYLTSATPAIPRLQMFGQWSITRDKQLVIEQCTGAEGVVVEASRWTRAQLGDEQREFGMLRRIFCIENVDPGAITVSASRSGGGGLEEIVMKPYLAPLTR